MCQQNFVGGKSKPGGGINAHLGASPFPPVQLEMIIMVAETTALIRALELSAAVTVDNNPNMGADALLLLKVLAAAWGMWNTFLRISSCVCSSKRGYAVQHNHRHGTSLWVE